LNEQIHENQEQIFHPSNVDERRSFDEIDGVDQT
jgi:hypothetical protein